MTDFSTTTNKIMHICYLAGFLRGFLKMDGRLSLTQYRILSSLGSRAQGLTVSSISLLLHVSASAVSGSASKLEGGGFLRHVDGFSGSQRAAFVVTGKGLELVSSVNNRLVATLFDDSEGTKNDKGLLSALSPDYIAGKRVSEAGARDHCVNYPRMEVVLLLESCFNVICHKYGLSVLEYRVLVYSNLPVGAERLSKVADELFVKPAHLAAAVQSLSRCSLIIRSRGAIDHRTASIELTSDGYRMLQTIPQEFAEYSINHFRGCMRDKHLNLPEASCSFAYSLLEKPMPSTLIVGS